MILPSSSIRLAITGWRLKIFSRILKCTMVGEKKVNAILLFASKASFVVVVSFCF